MKKSLVSIIIPTKNSGNELAVCLASLKAQTYKNIEIIIVDGGSSDQTEKLAIKYGVKLYIYKPKVEKGASDAPHKRNYGVKKANGEYVYYLDADMELPKSIIQECVLSIKSGIDAVIIHEESVGEGIWARAKNLERHCYWGDDTVEAPRFIKKSVWDKLGGLDLTVGGGGDDWDFYQKLKDGAYIVTDIPTALLHHEGRLTLTSLIKKRFRSGLQSMKYVKKRPYQAIVSYFPIRLAYIRHWRLFLSRPIDTIYFIVMRTAEYVAGFVGIVYSSMNKL